MRRVVDTNVAIVANGRADEARGSRQPSVDCRLAAVEFLEALLRRGRIVVDSDGEIQSEYRRHLNPSGEPGVGDRFYREVLNRGGRIDRVVLVVRPDGSYAAFPDDPALEGFDRSDRKFAAAARLSKAPVANSVDSDWLDYRAALAGHGIAVDFVCGCNRTAWFAD